MGQRSEHDDETIQFPHAVKAPRVHERLAQDAHDAPGSDDKPTVVAASPSQSMLLVADPADALTSDDLGYPADDEPDTMMTRAPAANPGSRPRLPTPRMDLRMYTPASIGPTALTLAPAPVPRASFPLPRFDAPEAFPTSAPPARVSRVHPVAWVAVGVILGAGAMAAVLMSRSARDAPTNAAPSNVPVETDLDVIAPMPSAIAPRR